MEVILLINKSAASWHLRCFVKLLPKIRNYTVKYHSYLLLHPCPCNANNSARAKHAVTPWRTVNSKQLYVRSDTRAASAKRQMYIYLVNGRRLTNDQIAFSLSLPSSSDLPPSPPYPLAAICTNNRTVLTRRMSHTASSASHVMRRTLRDGCTAGAANAERRRWVTKRTRYLFRLRDS